LLFIKSACLTEQLLQLNSLHVNPGLNLSSKPCDKVAAGEQCGMADDAFEILLHYFSSTGYCLSATKVFVFIKSCCTYSTPTVDLYIFTYTLPSIYPLNPAFQVQLASTTAHWISLS
jgi:hypothetical protein